MTVHQRILVLPEVTHPIVIDKSFISQATFLFRLCFQKGFLILKKKFWRRNLSFYVLGFALIVMKFPTAFWRLQTLWLGTLRARTARSWSVNFSNRFHSVYWVLWQACGTVFLFVGSIVLLALQNVRIEAMNELQINDHFDKLSAAASLSENFAILSLTFLQ